MKVITEVDDMKRERLGLAGPVGFVPTMGYLHEGHLALGRRARAECASVVYSIFVNPTQFGPREDFGKYPRAPEVDLAMLEKEKTDIVFMPTPEEMYPLRYNTWVTVEKVTERLEGAVRPGHFRGVATVCNKLFNVVQPTKAYFGQKDAQQVVVIKKMTVDLNMNLEIVIVPTVREPDGLAMSSRNVYLNPEERKAATVLYKALTLAQQLYLNGIWDIQTIRGQMYVLLTKEPLITLPNIDYISIDNAETLEEYDPLGKLKTPALVSLAVRIGKTRLIDNIRLGS
ncbi:MAG: pantoate--beta-alanine ligase [Dehalococcoidales bacterium]|nr:pantoate--beta-alanine ligase [Dehalococcoidales bacterium]